MALRAATSAALLRRSRLDIAARWSWLNGAQAATPPTTSREILTPADATALTTAAMVRRPLLTTLFGSCTAAATNRVAQALAFSPYVARLQGAAIAITTAPIPAATR